MHLIPIRLGARFVDPDAFVISSAVMKTHNMVVATMSIKNMVLGAAAASASRRERGLGGKARSASFT